MPLALLLVQGLLPLVVGYKRANCGRPCGVLVMFKYKKVVAVMGQTCVGLRDCEGRLWPSPGHAEVTIRIMTWPR